MVEQCADNAEVAGSIPALGTIVTRPTPLPSVRVGFLYVQVAQLAEQRSPKP